MHHYKGQAGSKELSFQKGDEFKLFAEAQGWYKAYKMPLDNKEAGMIPGNYIKIIPEPSASAIASAPAKEAPGAETPPPVKLDAKKSQQTDLDDALARASRRRGMTEKEVEGEKQLKLRVQELENELKTSEFRHRAELSELKAENTKFKAQCKKLEEENTVLENKALLIESAAGLQNNSGEVEALRKEVEQLKASRKADVQKVSTQWERKMERAQAEIDELTEQVAKMTEKEKSLEAQLKKAGSGGSNTAAADNARVKELEKENDDFIAEIGKLKEQIGGYLDMVDDLKDELEEAKNGPGSVDPKELDELKDQLENSKAEEQRLRKAEKALLAEIQEMESKEDEHVSQLNDLMKTNGALLKELEKSQQRVQKLESENQDNQAALDELRLKLEEAQAASGKAEETGASVVELEGRIRALQQEKTSLSDALDKLREEQSDSQAELDVIRKEFEAERDGLQEQIAKLEAEVAESSSQLQKTKAALEGAKKKDAVQKNLAVIVEENDALLKACIDFESQMDKLENEVDIRNKKIASLSKMLRELIKKA